MIGDTVYDVRMAHNAGVRSVGVAWGYHATEELRLAGATWLVQNPSAILDVVEGVA